MFYSQPFNSNNNILHILCTAHIMCMKISLLQIKGRICMQINCARILIYMFDMLFNLWSSCLISYMIKYFKHPNSIACVLDWKQREIGKDQNLQFFTRSHHGSSYWENGVWCPRISPGRGGIRRNERVFTTVFWTRNPSGSSRGKW